MAVFVLWHTHEVSAGLDKGCMIYYYTVNQGGFLELPWKFIRNSV